MRGPKQCGGWIRAALALALITTVGAARGQPAKAPSAPATMERAAALMRSHSFAQAAALLRPLLAADPENRAAKEMLAYALESTGDLKGERRVRATLATEYPRDPRVQTDYGRVLERSGEESEALRAYRRARALSADGPAPDLLAAIERLKGRTGPEVEAPVLVMSDPDASASRVRAGAAIPLGSHYQATLLASRYAADARSGPAATAADAAGFSLVRREAGGGYWAVGPTLHLVSPRGTARRDVGVGGAVEGSARAGPAVEARWSAEANSPWDEAAVAVLRGGRSTSAEGHLYAHGLSQRLLLQAGARRRQLSIVATNSTNRPRAWQSLWLAGVDLVAWRKPGAALRGEMLDERMIAPATMPSAVTLAYRHYDVATRTTPAFATILGLAPRGSIDEASVATTLASSGGSLGLGLRAGLAWDSAREARLWSAGGSVVWAPHSTTRIALGYEGAAEAVTGIVGQRRAGWLSIHVDL